MFSSKDVFLTPPSGGYNIARSVRLRSSATAYFNRTPASAGSAQKFTISCWVKLGSSSQTSGEITLLNAGTGAQTNTGNDSIQLRTNGTALQIGCLGQSGTGGNYAQFSAVLRDYAAWYHIVVAIDTTQATQSNRCRAYINGVEQTSYVANGFTSSYSFTYLNQVYAHLIGQQNEGAGPIYTDAYLTEYNFINNQQLTPSSFGTTNAITGVWQPAKYTGTYGTNGFYLNFSDNSGATSTTIGKDYSGNGNNWTPNNISVTAGYTYDSVTDVPTLTSTTAANYCVMNPLSKNNVGVIYNGNLAVYNTTLANYPSFGGTFYVSSGKWYWEVVMSGSGTAVHTFGFTNQPAFGGAYQTQSGSVGYTNDTGAISQNGSTVSTGSSFTYGDIIGIALNLDAGTATFYKNNVATGSVVTGLSGSYTPAIAINYYPTGVANINFGQQGFTYTPPTGFVALNTFNL